jgi:hypothetical protein
VQSRDPGARGFQSVMSTWWRKAMLVVCFLAALVAATWMAAAERPPAARGGAVGDAECRCAQMAGAAAHCLRGGAVDRRDVRGVRDVRGIKSGGGAAPVAR